MIPKDAFEHGWIPEDKKPIDSYPVLLQLKSAYNTFPFMIGRWIAKKGIWVDIDYVPIRNFDDIISWRFIKDYEQLEKEHNEQDKIDSEQIEQKKVEREKRKNKLLTLFKDFACSK